MGFGALFPQMCLLLLEVLVSSERGHNRIFLKYHFSRGVSDFFSSARDVFSVSSQVTKDGKPLRKWTGFAVN